MKFQSPIILLLISIISITALAQDKINLSVSTIDNKNIEISELYKEGPILINFWALWCEPCKVEMRSLKILYEKYKDRGFTILGINQDSPRSLAKVKAFVNSHNLTFPIVLDPNQEIFQKFNGQSIPLSILFNKKGEVVYTHIGYLPGDEIELENEILKLEE